MIIGITGKIASGKTEIMKILQKKGFFCIYADKIVHDLYKRNGEGAKRIEVVFGKKFLDNDGAVDRKKLRAMVFSDENKLKLLNNIIHPIVYKEIQSLVKKSKNENIAIEAVYFDQGSLLDFADKVVWVERPKDQVLNVLQSERNFAPEMAEQIYKSISVSSEVNFVLQNDSDLGNLSKEIEKFISNC